MPAASNQGWRDYWKSNRPASCVPANEATAAEIAAYWLGVFADVADQSRILDIATGNGILLAHAANAAVEGGKTFALTGVDLADIAPQKYLDEAPAGFDDIRFVGKTAAEALPFEVHEFDVVVSQYGLEYAQLDKALAEVERVLAPGGRFVWLAHCDDSEVVLQNRDQGAEVDFLLKPRGPIDAMEHFVARLGKGKKPSNAAQRLQAALADAERYCRDHPPAKVVVEVCTVIADSASRWQSFRPDDLARMLADARARLIHHRQRINDLSNAVVTPERLRSIETILQSTRWREHEIVALRAGSAERPIGLQITAQRGD